MTDEIQTTANDAVPKLNSALANLIKTRATMAGRIDQVEALVAQLSQCIVLQNENILEQTLIINRLNETNSALVDNINKLNGRLVILENESRTNLFAPPIN